LAAVVAGLQQPQQPLPVVFGQFQQRPGQRGQVWFCSELLARRKNLSPI